MKNFAKFLVVALVVALVASIFAFSSSAAVSPNGDPKALKPGSEEVVFIMDADENGNLPGDGSGKDAQNPLKPTDHENFDPEADVPQFDLQTAFYQATEQLETTGGTIVICGPVHLTGEQSYGSGTSQRDVRTAPFGEKVIKFTSVYNGVDYRETNGACLTVTAPAQLSISGSSIWENIRLGAGGAERVIAFEYYTTLVGEGVECFPLDSAFEGVATNYISLAGGKRYGQGKDVAPTLTVQSGTYNKVVAGMWGVTDKASMEPATTYLTLEGTTTVLGQIVGTIGRASPFSGHVNITINGGTYECDISCVGPTGMLNTDGTAKLTINGGTFESVWSICATDMAMINNPPATSIVDFSGWTGETEQLAYAHYALDGFTKVILPEGVTEETLDGYLSVEETTEAPVEDEETDAPVEDEEDNNDEDVEEDKKDEDEGKIDVNDGDKGGIPAWVWIVVVVAAVVIVGAAVAVVIVVLKKNKK